MGGGAGPAWAGRLSLEGRCCGRCGEGATCREPRPGSCTEGGEICKLLLPHGCSFRSIHIEMRPARASSAAGRCHASARPAACQLGQWGWQGPASHGGAAQGPAARRGGRRREPSYPSRSGAAVSRTLALQLGASRRERTGTDGFGGGPGSMPPLPADAPRQRYSPSAAARTCRSINRFYNLMQQLPARLGQMPPQNYLRPHPSPRGAPAVRAGIPARQAVPRGASFTSFSSPYKELSALGLSRGTEWVSRRTGLRLVEEKR